ncbi:MAG: prepilin-type N-terminal cleavage/methylation domain-containing protein [Magnetococcus sp. DMHC-1]|nr:prepilin-type N-terminal cleavage/methylation domain-containing protein [Magnetococcales bacterium]MBF0154898.1 prepilin-type N-terminal cleavage/methylation domain-containing protein [Magnetococcales bacterium]
MKTTRCKAGKGQTGFTLIEILIVILVIGILGGIAVTQFGDVTRQARTNTAALTARSTATWNACRAKIALSFVDTANPTVAETASLATMCGATP